MNPINTSYTIKKKIGQGQYGKCYIAEGNSDGKTVALKVIDLSNLNQEEIQKSKNEAIVLKELNHPNIIHFIDFFISKKPFYFLNIIAEYADGGDLSDKIKNNASTKTHFDESQILDWLIQLCLALSHIHSKNIIHRDIKPSNIFLMKNGKIKLGDFGVSKVLESCVQKAKTMIGTPYYISPEIVNGNEYTCKTDIWSLGVVLYELMTLVRPFEDKNNYLLKISKGDFNKNLLKNNMYSKELNNLIESMLNVNEDERPDAMQILKLDFIRNRIKNTLKDNKLYNNGRRSKMIEENEKKNLLKPNFNIHFEFNSGNQQINKEKKFVIIPSKGQGPKKEPSMKNLNSPIINNSKGERKFRMNYCFYNNENKDEEEKPKKDFKKKKTFEENNRYCFRDSYNSPSEKEKRNLKGKELFSWNSLKDSKFSQNENSLTNFSTRELKSQF